MTDRPYVGVVRGRGRTRVRVMAELSREPVVRAILIGAPGASSLQAVSGLDPVQGGALALLIATATSGPIRLYWSWRNGVTRGRLEILENAVRPG